MQKNLITPFVIAILIIGGGAFYGGVTYANAKATNQRTQQRANGSGARGQSGQFGAFAGAGGTGTRGGMGNFVAGEIVSKDANSVTVKLRDGGSKIVFLSASTTVAKMTNGSTDDLSTGAEVTVNGTNNADGSVTASTIQIRPAGQAMPFMREGQPRGQQ